MHDERTTSKKLTARRTLYSDKFLARNRSFRIIPENGISNGLMETENA